VYATVATLAAVAVYAVVVVDGFGNLMREQSGFVALGAVNKVNVSRAALGAVSVANVSRAARFVQSNFP